VKVPQTWFEQDEIRLGIRPVVENFLNNTGRIVTVVVYATAVRALHNQDMMLIRHRFLEYGNASHRFDHSKSWTLFKNYEVPDDWGGAHPKWTRVFSQGFIMRTS
jgi:hypothetical protein